MSEQKTTVYKLGRPMVGRSTIEAGCRSYVDYLGNACVWYYKGVPAKSDHPLFAFRTIEDLVSYRKWDFYETKWVAWEALAEGVSEPPRYVLEIGALSDMEDFWRDVAHAISPQELLYDFDVQSTPPGTVLCESITVVRLFTLEELITIKERLDL